MWIFVVKQQLEVFMNSKPAISASRTYVAICKGHTFPEGREKTYFRKFILPTHYVEGYEYQGEWMEDSYCHILQNTASAASWYFLNKLNFEACISECIPFEEYNSLLDQDEIIAQRSQEHIDFYASAAE
jgi:hypothetical protein